MSRDPETESASRRLAPLTDPRSKRSTVWSLNKRGCGFGDMGPLSCLKQGFLELRPAEFIHQGHSLSTQPPGH